MPATHPYRPRIAVLFDFDRTLATDTVEGLCKAWDMGREEWESRYLEPLGDNWDGILKRGRALIDCGRDLDRPLTDALFDDAMKHILLYPGVDELRDHLTRTAQDVLDDAQIELAVLSSGFVEVIERTPLKHLFDAIWAGGFYQVGDEGEAVAVKRAIAHPEKARYIEAYAKGLDLDSADEPQTNTPNWKPEDMHIPLDQVIYVGDGASDLHAFEFLAHHGGLAIAVSKSADFGHVDEQTEGQRVENLAPPDYSEGAELLESLRHAVRSAASRAALRMLGEGE